ncbi:hypothetical protein BH11MYX4_BH11MYX4_58400 [soil metagenome]
MSRDTIVGREYIVGAQHDYDELLDHAMGAEMGPEYGMGPEYAMGAEPQQQKRPHPQQQFLQHQPQPPYGPSPYAYQYPPPQGWPAPQPRATSPAYERDARGPRLVPDHPRRARQFPIGFVKTTIGPGAVEDIEVKPQVHFRGERLAVAPSIARFFSVVDIKVGKDSQLAAAGEMPAESFSALAVGVRLELDTAQPGIVIIIKVRNTDAAPHNFEAVLYGTVLE